MNYSPAPWSVHPFADGTPRVVCKGTPDEFIDAEIAIGSGEKLIGFFGHRTGCGGYNRPTLAEMHANARLAIAAPELLEALEDAMEHVPITQQVKARAAIAKAKGIQ